MSEAQRVAATAESSKSQLVDITAGIASSRNDKSPANFAWPVPEVTKHVTDFQNVHTEYRDNFHEWESGKVDTHSILFQSHEIGI